MARHNAVLGAICHDDGTDFSVFAPYAASCKLRLYADDSTPDCKEYDMYSAGRGIYSLTLPGNLAGIYYTYVVDGVETVDPYAKSCGANSKRGYILSGADADPVGWAEDKFEPKPPIIWEVHVRDFSSDISLNIKDAGKYSAFRSGVTSADGRPVLLDHLKYLGVTYVQLMPVLDFGSVDEVEGGYNWGYDPMLYFAPEGSYSSDPHDGLARVRELKQLVKNLHSAGIGVILDVVYNHTYKKLGNPLDVCAPDYYYRMKDGVPADGSGCGNETRTESTMFSKLIVDSVTYLAREYHIDGFRFDLMGLIDVDTVNRVRRALNDLYPDGRGRNILMYGEPWYWMPPQRVKGADRDNLKLLDSGIGAFNDVLRDGIRGGNFSGGRGYVQGDLSLAPAILNGVSGGKYPCAGALDIKSPAEQVIYSACHDNYTLFDQLSLSVPESADKVAMQRMAAFIVLSGLGVPMLQAGEEFLRTKMGDGNSFKSGDAVNKLDWRRMSDNIDTVDYYKGLIEIRKSNPVFDDLANSRDKFIALSAPDGAIAYRIGDFVYAVNNTDRAFCVPLNEEETLGQLASLSRASARPFKMIKGGVTVVAHGVFAGKIIL